MILFVLALWLYSADINAALASSEPDTGYSAPSPTPVPLYIKANP